MKPPTREVLKTPELRLYTEDFGLKEDDNAFVYDRAGHIVGAVWGR
jgi:hypothetical protein